MENSLGKNLRFLRKSKDMTQKELAKILNVDVTTISKWERGKNLTNIETLLRLSEVFEVELSDLLN